MNGQNRDDIQAGLEVEIILKKDQSTQPSHRAVAQDYGLHSKATAGKAGKLTPQSRFAPTGRARGVVQDILTSAPFHSRGIKVRLTSGEVGRVQNIVGD